MIIDGFQNLSERYVVSLGKQIAQRIGLICIERWRSNMERSVFAKLQARVGSRLVVGCLILGG